MQFKFNFTHKQPSEGAKKKEEQVGYMVDLSSELPAFMTIPKHKWVSFDLVRTCSSKGDSSGSSKSSIIYGYRWGGLTMAVILCDPLAYRV